MELSLTIIFSYCFSLLLLGILLLIPAVRKKISWKLITPCLIIPALLAALLYFIYGVSVSTDTEYFGGYAVEADYFEDWDEEVPCTHPVYCTRQVQKSYDCGTGGKSQTCYRTETETYECGKQHLYDVDYHPPYWEVVDSNGKTFSIGQDTFEKLTKRWNNKKFVDLHRSYHSNDGDKFVTGFDNLDDHIETTAVEHNYLNKIQASNSLLRFRDISPEEAIREGVYSYPSINNYFQKNIIAPSNLSIDTPQNEHFIQLINARLGRKKQVRVFLLVYKDKSAGVFETQQRYWQGGNKNEVVIGVGVDGSGKVQWANAFAWAFTSDEYGNKLYPSEISNFIAEQEVLDVPRLGKWLYSRIENDYVRRPFTPINETTDIAYPFWLCILTILLSNSVTVILTIFPVAPDIVNWYNGWRWRSFNKLNIFQ